MSKLSGWSMFWLAMTATCIIATVFSLIQANRKKKSESKIDYGTPIALDKDTSILRRSDNDGIFPEYLRKQYFETTD